jgi:hypothetical protein
VGAEAWGRVLALFSSHLSPGGVAVFTAYGRLTAEQSLRPRRRLLSFSEAQVREVLRDYDRDGFGFAASLVPQRDYGDAIASPAWVCKRLEETQLQLLLYVEGGWGRRPRAGQQDVIACTTSSETLLSDRESPP